MRLSGSGPRAHDSSEPGAAKTASAELCPGADLLRFVGPAQPEKVGLLEEGVATAVEKRSEQFPGAAPGLLFAPSLASLLEQLTRAPGQIRGNRFVADFGLDPGQGDLGVAPLFLAQELLRLEQGSQDIAVQLGDPQVLLELTLMPQGAGPQQVATAGDGGRQAQRDEGRGDGVAARKLDPAFPERRAPGLDRAVRRESSRGPRPAPGPSCSVLPAPYFRQCRQMVSRSRATLGTSRDGGTTSSSTTWRTVSSGVSPLKGGRPVSIS